MGRLAEIRRLTTYSFIIRSLFVHYLLIICSFLSLSNIDVNGRIVVPIEPVLLIVVWPFG